MFQAGNHTVRWTGFLWGLRLTSSELGWWRGVSDGRPAAANKEHGEKAKLGDCLMKTVLVRVLASLACLFQVEGQTQADPAEMPHPVVTVSVPPGSKLKPTIAEQSHTSMKIKVVTVGLDAGTEHKITLKNGRPHKPGKSP